MTTSPTIDGVRRELLEKALRDANTIRFSTDKHVTELRALLEAQSELCEIDLTAQRLAHAENVIEQQSKLITSLRTQLVESYSIGAIRPPEAPLHSIPCRKFSGNAAEVPACRSDCPCDIPDFTPGNGNSARRRIQAIEKGCSQPQAHPARCGCERGDHE